jgi:hypothetical protein
LIHEIAHELMHKGPNAPADRRISELEAEAVAFVVGKHFDLDVGGSPNYVALHGATPDLIMAHLDRIRRTATAIIGLADSSQEQECIAVGTPDPTKPGASAGSQQA